MNLCVLLVSKKTLAWIPLNFFLMVIALLLSGSFEAKGLWGYFINCKLEDWRLFLSSALKSSSL